MSTPSYDVIVIGAGPAGLVTATEVARTGLKTLCLDKLAPGGQLINLTELHEFEEPWGGADMASRLTDEAAVAGVEMGFGDVSKISGGDPWTVETAEGEAHTARLLVIATGLNKGKLGLPNEGDFEGRGVSHCASCDGPLYAGLPVVVAGAAGWAGMEAKELAGVAGGVTVVDASSAETPEGVERVVGRIVGLEGGSAGLETVVVDSDGQRKSIPASAVFVYVNQSPAAEFVPDSLARDATGHIVVDAEGRTSVPTIYAVGDVRAGTRPYLNEAVADGERAAKAIVAALKKN
jgi:thioredoxin reductase (NADPH)